ncbi:MAG TPA: hypothetical protein VL283_02785 [Candidatus Baltobacteraceae bacterium]|nr:hypothetical protein [Candidatus Baltobacteraceae bacterium]
MPLLLLIVVLFFPRLGILLLALFTTWFMTAGLGLLSLILGFIFAPITLLWYSVVMNSFGGVWGPLQIIVLILALLADFGGGWGGYHHHHKYYVVEEDHA